MVTTKDDDRFWERRTQAVRHALDELPKRRDLSLEERLDRWTFLLAELAKLECQSRPQDAVSEG